MSEFRTQDVGGTYLIVKPSESLQIPVGQHRSPGILSRGEILRRREKNERARQATSWITAYVPPPLAPAVEMHEADVTPLPKNKGGRPRKKV